jgi:hypothetical protein
MFGGSLAVLIAVLMLRRIGSRSAIGPILSGLFQFNSAL